MSKILLDSQPIVVPTELAIAVGLNESIVLQQVHYWVQNKEKANQDFHDGRYWVYNTYEQWQKQFPYWSIKTIKRIITALEKKGLILTGNYNKLKIDRTKWYTIDYNALESLHNSPSGHFVPMDGPDCPHAEGQLDPTITIDYTKDYSKE